MNSKKIRGNKGEKIATEFLMRKNFSIIQTNYHSRYGEVDIIMQNEQYIIFVEVKMRKIGGVSRGMESISKNKQRKIIQTACIYIMKNKTDKQMRFDVIDITEDTKNKIFRIRHLENAFELGDNSAIF